jgi:hypothetical protein
MPLGPGERGPLRTGPAVAHGHGAEEQVQTSRESDPNCRVVPQHHFQIMAAHTKSVLMVVTSNDKLGDLDEQTG